MLALLALHIVQALLSSWSLCALSSLLSLSLGAVECSGRYIGLLIS